MDSMITQARIATQQHPNKIYDILEKLYWDGVTDEREQAQRDAEEELSTTIDLDEE